VFQDYKKQKPVFLEVLNKIILIIPVILVFVVGVSLIVHFSGQLSSKDKTALRARRRLFEEKHRIGADLRPLLACSGHEYRFEPPRPVAPLCHI
jgi:hypothetical protein